MHCSTPIFDHACDKELRESIFVEEEQDDAIWGDPKPPPLAAPIELASTTSTDGPSTSTTLVPFELVADLGGEQTPVEG